MRVLTVALCLVAGCNAGAVDRSTDAAATLDAAAGAAIDARACPASNAVGQMPRFSCPATTMSALLCNPGGQATVGQVIGAFYVNDPRMAGAVFLCAAHTKGALAAGACEPVQCHPLSFAPSTMDLWFRVDDDGTTPQDCAPQGGLSHRFDDCTLG